MIDRCKLQPGVIRGIIRAVMVTLLVSRDARLWTWSGPEGSSHSS